MKKILKDTKMLILCISKMDNIEYNIKEQFSRLFYYMYPKDKNYYE